jgi:hypothetical protein
MAEPDPPAGGLTYDPEIGPGYFTQIRSDFLRFPGYSPTMKLVYLVLLSYAGAGATAWPGQVRLARECGVSERTIRTVLADLAAVDLLTIKQQGLNKTNLYHVRKLPLVMRDRQRLPVQNGNPRRSKTAAVAREGHTVEIHTVETGSDPALLNMIHTWAYQHRIRVTPEQVQALAAAAGSPARWQAVSAGAGALAEVQQRLEGT